MNPCPTKSARLSGAVSLYLRTIARHSGSRGGIAAASDIGASGPTATPSVSAMAGHTARHSNTSPLLMLKVSFAHAGEVASHSQARASRSASTASRTHEGPPGNDSGLPASRSSAAYTPIAGTTFMWLPSDSPKITWGRKMVQLHG